MLVGGDAGTSTEQLDWWHGYGIRRYRQSRMTSALGSKGGIYGLFSTESLVRNRTDE